MVCGRVIDRQAWLSTDETLGAFLDRLEAAILPAEREAFRTYRMLCEHRERDGRERFGLAYLDRDNLAEDHEELGDSLVYKHLAMLRRFYEAGDQEGIDLALQGAWHSFKSYEYDLRMVARWGGSP